MMFFVVAFLAFLFMVFIGTPVVVALGCIAIAVLTNTDGLSIHVLTQVMYIGLDRFILLAVPLFLFAGMLMEAAGMTTSLSRLSKAIFGKTPGGCSCSCVLSTMLFAASSGSSTATTLAIGRFTIPEMVRDGMTRDKSAALQVISAELGVIIPPSIPMVVYGTVTETPIDLLFVAGIIPGLLLAAVLMVYAVFTAKKGPAGRPSAEKILLGPALLSAIPAILMPLIIVGSILSGIATTTEAAITAVLYGLVVLAVKRKFRIAVLRDIVQRTALQTAQILIIFSVANVVSYIITWSGTGIMLMETLRPLTQNSTWFFLVVNAILFVLGMFIEPTAIILMLAPLLVPLATSAGIDPVHFGIVVIMNMALAMATPPFGINLFAVSTITNIRQKDLYLAIAPLVLVVASVIVLIIFVPEIIFIKKLSY